MVGRALAAGVEVAFVARARGLLSLRGFADGAGGAAFAPLFCGAFAAGRADGFARGFGLAFPFGAAGLRRGGFPLSIRPRV
jgi:hypothetical protein